MSSVHCGVTPATPVRMLETEDRHFSNFTLLDFLLSTVVTDY
jgi:hypothetical protein